VEEAHLIYSEICTCLFMPEGIGGDQECFQTS
jgi:hypothetical protein